MGMENILTNKTVLVVIVTYNPDIEFLITNINKLNGNNITVYISDNGSDNFSEIETQLEKIKRPKIFIKKNLSNVGLASAQNSGIKYAQNASFEYICFFDQDTDLPQNYIEDMLLEYSEAQMFLEERQLGILAPNFYDFRLKEFTHFAKLTDSGYRNLNFVDEHFLDVSFVVSSGSFMKTELTREIGLFKKEYFIDQIDTEYSLRVISNGYKILVTSRICLNHTIGKRDKHNFMGLIIKPNHHPARRKYFIFRNGVDTCFRYSKKFPGFKKLILKRFIHDFLGVILYEKDKVRKIKAMVKGIHDGRVDYVKWSNDEFI